jgi:hypothetical protein
VGYAYTAGAAIGRFWKIFVLEKEIEHGVPGWEAT